MAYSLSREIQVFASSLLGDILRDFTRLEWSKQNALLSLWKQLCSFSDLVPPAVLGLEQKCCNPARD